MCKFTPLGFETSYVPKVSYDIVGVNLPRWGLKQIYKKYLHPIVKSVNLPRWGLKRL